MVGKISALVILALDELSVKYMEANQEAKIRDLLLKEDPKKLKHDLALAPVRVHDYIVKLLNSKDE